MIHLDIKDFSEFPGGRFLTDGRFSGERYRTEVLIPRLSAGENLEIGLDGVAGLPSSFLEEAFGGLVRATEFSAHDLRSRLRFVAQTDRMKSYPDLIWRYIDNAATA